MQPKSLSFVFFVAGVIAGMVGGALTPALALAEEEIGKVDYPAYAGATGTRVDGSTERLYAHTEIFTDEVVTTPATGATQLRFLDRSTLRIGPASEVTLDRYVYDPGNGNGAALFNLSKGIMRFISGDILTEENIILETPHATITIRGTDVIVRTDDIETQVTVVDGAAETCSKTTALCTTNAGANVSNSGEVTDSDDRSDQSADGMGDPSGDDPGSSGGTGADPASSGSKD